MPENQHIQLVSPVMDHIPTYVVDNSACLVCGGFSVRVEAYGDKTMEPEKVREYLGKVTKTDLAAADLSLCTCEKPTQMPLVQRDQYKGKTVCICGSGPSLKTATRRIKRGEFDHVWGCNDALMWLTKNGYTVTHGAGIDQSEALYEECWVPVPPDVPYLLASSVSPKLIKHLRDHDRDVTLFHSHIGFDGEHELYGILYPGTALTGEGLNVVNRSICIAEYMGYDKISVAGCDCAFNRIGWRTICEECGVGRSPTFAACTQCGCTTTQRKPKYGFHVQGDDVEGIVLEGEIDGRHWATKPDMLVSAISLVGTKKRLTSRLELIGDTLPKALQHKDQKFLERCIRWAHPGELEQHQAEQAAKRWAPSASNIKRAILDMQPG